MTNPTDHTAFLDARVSLLARRLLRRREREALVEAAAGDLAPLLQQAGLDTLARERPADTFSLEQQLATVLVEECLLIIHGLDSEGSRFIRNWIRRLELINLKLILRSKLAGLDRQETLEALFDLDPLTTLPLEALLHTDSAEELLRRLETTPYGRMTRQARKVYAEEMRLFDAEATLDAHYFHGLVQLSRAIPGVPGEQLRQLLGTWLDQVNLISLMRFRLIYRLDAPHAYFLLAPGGRRLSLVDLQVLARQDSLAAMLARLPDSLRLVLEDASDIETVEFRMISRVRREARLLLRRKGRGVARAFAYLYLREQQIQLIHTVLKGHLLGLDAELIRFCANPMAVEERNPDEVAAS